MDFSIKESLEISVQLGFHQFNNSITEEYLKAIVSENEIQSIQSTETLSEDTLKLLNEHLFSKRDDIWLRLYSYEYLDLSCFRHLSDLRMLQLDLIDEIVNIESLTFLKKLENLNIRIESLKNFSLLQYINQNLESLYLGKTKSKRPDLSEILRFRNLKVLGLRGQSKNVHKIAELKHLESLALGGLTSKDISWLAGLSNLNSLSIDIFKTDDFSPLEKLKNLKIFSVSELRGATELPFLAKMKGLEELELTYLNKVKRLPNLGSDTSLKSVLIYEMEALEDISFLYSCTKLESARLRFSNRVLVEKLEGLFSLPNLKEASVVIASIDNEPAIEEMMHKFGIEIID
jgi:hypothetical protein